MGKTYLTWDKCIYWELKVHNTVKRKKYEKTLLILTPSLFSGSALLLLTWLLYLINPSGSARQGMQLLPVHSSSPLLFFPPCTFPCSSLEHWRFPQGFLCPAVVSPAPSLLPLSPWGSQGCLLLLCYYEKEKVKDFDGKVKKIIPVLYLDRNYCHISAP